MGGKNSRVPLQKILELHIFQSEKGGFVLTSGNQTILLMVQKSCNAWHVEKPVDNGIFTISTGARQISEPISHDKLTPNIAQGEALRRWNRSARSQPSGASMFSFGEEKTHEQ